MTILRDKNVLLGVTGSIAAYKSAELIRNLREQGANVRVVMTENAQEFITPLTLQALSGNPACTQFLDHDVEASMSHITLAKWADVFLIAPATANIMAKFAHGLADDLLSSLHLVTKAPVVLAPAMNQAMWQHVTTQTNKNLLLQRGAIFVGPEIGSQACGDFGMGRMLDPENIVSELLNILAPKPLSGVKVIITAGPTQEAIDPVRYITNHSSGKMGYALAQAAQRFGAETLLISGPTHLPTPFGVNTLWVTTAEEMYQNVMANIHDCHIFISCAAVGDFRCATMNSKKIKKDELRTLPLIPNKDIVLEVSHLPNKPFTVGFAAETEDVIKNATKKLQAKGLDMIIANQVGIANIGFNSDFNAVTALTQDDRIEFAHAHKQELASDLIRFITNQYHNYTEVDKTSI